MIFHAIIHILAVIITSYVTGVGVIPPGFNLTSIWMAIIFVLIFWIINHTIKPVVSLVAIPINAITLGLFSFVINGAMVLISAKLVYGFHMPSFVMAVWFALVLSIVNSILHIFHKD